MKQNNKALSIQVNLNGLSFCILNKSTLKVEHLHELEFEKTHTPHEILPYLKEELSTKTVFSQDYSDVVIIHQNELSTLVPNALFDEKISADYLKYNSKILKSDYISYDDLDSMEAKNVYVPYVNINNYVFDTFGQFTYKHSLTVLSQSLLNNPVKDNSKKVFINVNKSSFEIVVFNESKIVLSNVHRYYSKEDFIYFVLFTFEQLELDPEKTEVILSGKVEKNDQLFEVLFTYIRNVSLIEPQRKIDLIYDNLDYKSYYLILNSF